MREGDRAAHAGRRQRGGPQQGPVHQHQGRHDRHADAGLHEGEDGVHLAALDREPRREPGLPARLERDVAQVVARPEHHQRGVFQLGERQLGVLGGRRTRGDGRHDQALPQDRGGVQAGVDALLGRHDQRQVEAVRQQVGGEIRGAALRHVQGNIGMSGPEGAEHGRDERRAEARRRAEPDLATAQAHDVPDRVAGGVGVRDHPLREREQRLSGGGEGHRTPDPFEQRCAERRLQGVNLLTQGRLADAEKVRRLSEMPDFCHRYEVPKLLQLHVDSLRLWRFCPSCIRRIVGGYLPSRAWQ
jgi:hypothetical protein